MKHYYKRVRSGPSQVGMNGIAAFQMCLNFLQISDETLVEIMADSGCMDDLLVSVAEEEFRPAILERIQSVLSKGYGDIPDGWWESLRDYFSQVMSQTARASDWPQKMVGQIPFHQMEIPRPHTEDDIGRLVAVFSLLMAPVDMKGYISFSPQDAH